MGNSPSQVGQKIVKGASEPDQFDLDAISGDSDEEERPLERNVSVPEEDAKKRRKSRTGSAAALKVDAADDSLSRKLLAIKREQQAVKGYGSLPESAEDKKMRDADETSSDDTSSDAISVAPLSPRLLMPRTGGTKRKRASSVVEETPIAKLQKRQKKKSSPPTTPESAGKELRRVASTTMDSVPQRQGLQALEHDAELESQKMHTQSRSSPQLPPTLAVSKTKTPNSGPSKFKVFEDGTDAYEPPSRRSMATSFAKRTFSSVIEKAGEGSRNLQDDSGSSSPNFSGDEAEAEQHGFSDRDLDSSKATPVPWPLPKRRTKSKNPTTLRSSKPVSKRIRTTPQSVEASSDKDYEIDNNASSDPDTDTLAEAESMGRPSSKEKKCSECQKVLKTRKALNEHEQSTGHVVSTVRTEVTGRFTDYEFRRLARYKAGFCRMYNITGDEFNDMMTDSCRRGAGNVWSYHIISKQDFLAQYYDVLPNRNRKSMARFRERNWQNATGSKDWTTEDDDELVKLVGELGTKWVVIGQALTRTQDAVQQRWKKYLQYRDTKKGGAWSPEEDEALQQAVTGAKKRGGLSQSASSDKRIAWSTISDALNGARTPKQCADRWQVLRQTLYRRQARKEKNRRIFKLASHIVDSENEPDADNIGTGSGEDHGEVDIEAKTQIGPRVVIKARQKPGEVFRKSDIDQNRSAAQSKRRSKDGQSHEARSASGVFKEQESVIPESSKPPPITRRKTRSKTMTLSQAFANTQANTSPVRRTRHPAPNMSDLPSPGLPLDVQPQSANGAEAGEEPVPASSRSKNESSREEEDEEVVNALSKSQDPPFARGPPDGLKLEDDDEATDNHALHLLPAMPSRRVSQDQKKVPIKEEQEDEETSSDDESGDFSHERMASMSDSDDGNYNEADGDIDDDSIVDYGHGNGSGYDDSDDYDEDDGYIDPFLPPGDDVAYRGHSDYGYFNSDGNVFSHGDEDNEDHNFNDSEDSEDSMVQGTRNDFMASIKESAEKAKLVKQMSSSQKMRSILKHGDGSGESESGSDEDSIAHG